METSYLRMMSNFPISVKTPLIFPIPWAPAPFPKRGVGAMDQKGQLQAQLHKHIWAVACDFQQLGILTSIDSDEPV